MNKDEPVERRSWPRRILDFIGEIIFEGIIRVTLHLLWRGIVLVAHGLANLLFSW